jgi:hypothetical protein
VYETNNTQELSQSQYEVEFIESSHTYVYEGIIIPSVSSVMSSLSTEKYKNISRERLNNAADRGTRVHKAVENYEKYGKNIDDLEIKPYLLAYKIAKKLHRFTVMDTERQLTNGRYAGTLDMIAVHEGKLIIIDLKATSTINYDLLEVQLAAYYELCHANNISVQDTWVLHLKPGKFKFEPITPNQPLWIHLLEHYEQTNNSD